MKEKRDFGFGFRHGQIRGPPTSSTLFSNQEGPLPNKEMWCTFCNGPHPSNRCAVVTDPETKKNILRQKGRCFGCLRSGHISKDCSARCYRCGGKHHLSLCSTQKQPMQFRQLTPRRHTGKNWAYKFVKGREEDFCKEYQTKVRFNGDRPL